MVDGFRMLDKFILDMYGQESEGFRSNIAQLAGVAYGIRDKEELKLYIQNHQALLLESIKMDPANIDNDRMLHFMETHFRNYVDETCQLSNLGKGMICSLFPDIREQTNSSINGKLAVALRPLLVPEKCANCTIYWGWYFSQFWENWPFDMAQSMNGLAEEKLVNYLISQNFNPPAFYIYLTDQIIGELQGVDDPFFQEQVLESRAKHYNMVHAKMGKPFDREYPDIKRVLEEWLAREIRLCRLKQKKFNPGQLTIAPRNEVKIETSMSVAQTALFFKALIKSGIITNKVQTDVMKVVCEKYSSKREGEISVVSFHNKYYKTEDGTKEALKEMLKGFFKELDNA